MPWHDVRPAEFSTVDGRLIVPSGAYDHLWTVCPRHRPTLHRAVERGQEAQGMYADILVMHPIDNATQYRNDT